jgi:hypothetical protein
MKESTRLTLAALSEATWFRNVGLRDTDAAEVLSSWDDAIESCSTLEWENLCLEAANQYRDRLVERDPDRFASWNEIVAEVKPAAQALVLAKTAAIVARQSLPRVFVDTVDWDALHILMEAEFADVFPPGFYAGQAYWYVAGHFPCGWRGRFPQGRLVIF